MNTGHSWINEVLPLDRPEYAKQPEALLTDLIWRSEGSTLAQAIRLTRRSGLARLVPQYRHSSVPREIVETLPTAREADIGDLVVGQDKGSILVSALLDSIQAPKSRGVKSLVCVPVNPDVVALQTLRGIVNKPQPASIARIIETMGWLGGSDGRGHVAGSLLQAMSYQRADVDEGFTGLVDALFPEIAKHTWSGLVESFEKGPGISPEWPGIKPAVITGDPPGTSILASHKYTPFRWFWEKWKALCSNEWYDVLPARRFVDWATCLLRTALSFGYLWEADFFVKLHASISEELSNRKSADGSQAVAKSALHSMLQGGTVLATIEAPRVPAAQKHAWNALSNLLSRGYLIRKDFESYLSKESPFGVPSHLEDFEIVIQAWIDSLLAEDLERLSNPPEVDSNTAPNMREFVRYLLLPRSSDDDTMDQADFYYLARTNSRSLLWFQPGPEWLVVITSLLGGSPSGKCTMGMLLDDLRMLGLRVDRRVLVGMLEEAGLSTDSPDADNALVIQAGF
jgi:hypothetical protein